MSSNLINADPKDVNLIEQVKQSFVPKSLTTAIYQHQELNNYLDKIACKISLLIKCERVIVTIRQGNVEQIIASNVAIDKGDRHQNN